jgi:hypothetical protein
LGFKTSNLTQLENSVFQPVVFSITCLTGKYSKNDCFAVSFLKRKHGGCVSIIAAYEKSFSGYNDSLTEGLFNAIWPVPGLTYHLPSYSGSTFPQINTPSFDMGSIMDYGLFYMSNYGLLSNNPVVNHNIFYTREIFHLYGDPSMMMYTEQPIPIEQPSIFVKGDTIKVRTTDGDARISFHTLGTASEVDSYLGSSVNYITTADSVNICIDRHNCIPYIFTYHRNEYIQNDTISDNHTYLGKNIKAGRNVTTTKPEGDVVFNGANIVIQGGNVELHPGTTIINSNVEINPHVSHP